MTITVAPAIAPPFESVTFPRIRPASPCENAGRLSSNTASVPPNTRRNFSDVQLDSSPYVHAKRCMVSHFPLLYCVSKAPTLPRQWMVWSQFPGPCRFDGAPTHSQIFHGRFRPFAHAPGQKIAERIDGPSLIPNKIVLLLTLGLWTDSPVEIMPSNLKKALTKVECGR